MTQLLVDLDEAARALSLSKRSLQQLVYAGELPSVRIGRSRRVAVADLEAFVAALRADQAESPTANALVGAVGRVAVLNQALAAGAGRR